MSREIINQGEKEMRFKEKPSEVIGRELLADGITVELAKTKAQLYRKLNGHGAEKEANELWNPTISLSDPDGDAKLIEEHRNAFYLNTSDAIEVLADKVVVAGEDVLTIGGGGDFAQLFLLKGAKKLEICDISLPGILYNELKLAGLRSFSFEEYQNFFQLDDNLHGNTWIDVPLYEKLRPSLSEQAKVFFDTLINFPEIDEEVVKHPNGNFIRTRPTYNGDDNYLQTVGGLIKTHEGYDYLQKNARETQVDLHWRSIADYGEKYPVPKAVYLSNVGYEPASTVTLAQKMIQAGAEHVYFSMSSERLFAEQEGASHGGSYQLLDEEEQDEYWQEKLKKRSMLIDNVHTGLLGRKATVEFDLIAEVRKEDR